MTTPLNHGKGSDSAPDELPDYHEEQSHPVSAATGWFSDTARIRKYLIRGVILILILLFGPPAYRSIKGWRSQVLLEKSGRAFAVGDPQAGVTLLKQALALSPGSPEIQHAVELYDARAGDKPSLEILLSRMRQGKSLPGELLGIAEIEFHEGQKSLAEEALAHLPEHLNSAQLLRSYLVHSAILAQEGKFSQAADLCILKATTLDSDDASRLRVQAALFLLNQGNHGDQEAGKKAKEILQEVAASRSATSLTAWRILARLQIQSPDEIDKDANHELNARLRADFSSLRGTSISDQLLEADLELSSDASCKAALVKKLTARYAQSGRSEMLDYARWLNAHEMREDVITLAGPDRPSSDTDWLLIVLDAKSGLGRWNDVSGMLNTPAAAGIPDAVRHLFLARSAMMTGNDSLAEEEWRNVGGALPLEKPETLAYIAGYEEQVGVFNRAARTYREMADRKEFKVPGLVGLIRCQPRNAPEGKMIPLYEELVAAAPEYADAQGDLTYLKLLTGDNLAKSTESAETLLASHPTTLARISAAALARYRNGDFKGALDLYRGKAINWRLAPDPWKVIYVVVLNANGDPLGELKSFPPIDTSTLRPRELELLKKAQAGKSAFIKSN